MSLGFFYHFFICCWHKIEHDYLQVDILLLTALSAAFCFLRTPGCPFLHTQTFLIYFCLKYGSFIGRDIGEINCKWR